MVWGEGRRRTFGDVPKGETTHFQPAEEGSGALSVGDFHLGVDFSKASGAHALIVTVGLPMNGATEIKAGQTAFSVLLIGGKPPEPAAAGDKVVVGRQEVRFDGSKIVFGTVAGPPRLPKLGMW